MDLDLGFIGAHVAASDLCPSAKVFARRAQPPSETNLLGSCAYEVERLLSFASAAVRPEYAISDGVGSINPDETMESDGNRASPTPIIRGCRQTHFRHLPIWSRITSLRGHEYQPRAENNQGHENPSAA